MSTENKYSFGMNASSGDRILTTLNYDGMEYGELVAVQIVTMVSLLRAGVEMAEARGFTLDPKVKTMIGL